MTNEGRNRQSGIVATALRGWSENLSNVWRYPDIRGIERVVDALLVILRLVSVGYGLRALLANPQACRSRPRRDLAIELYVVLQFVVLTLMTSPLGVTLPTGLAFGVAAYVLFELFLSLFNIVFLGKIADVNTPPASVERSLLLLLFNAVQLPLAFAIFYRFFSGGRVDGPVVQAFLVLGTVGYPTDPSVGLIVAAQIFLDLVFLVLFLSAFAGRARLFDRMT
jgi:hypothetical protein